MSGFMYDNLILSAIFVIPSLIIYLIIERIKRWLKRPYKVRIVHDDATPFVLNIVAFEDDLGSAR